MFDDEIVSATELKNNQKKWFDRALKSPVSITNRKGKKLVLINREQVHDLVIIKEYAEMILSFCSDLEKSESIGEFMCSVMPWSQYLSKQERLLMRDELITNFNNAIHSGNWAELDEVTASWKATAEAQSNRRFMEIVNTPGQNREYTEIE